MRYRAPLFGLLAVLVLGVAFWYFGWEPLAEEKEQYETETADLEMRASQLQAEIAELRRVEENQLEIQAELALMEEYIPNEVAQPTALREFQSTADDAGVVIDNVSFGQPVAVEESPSTGDEGTTLAEISLTMTIEGGYFQLVDLLRRLEVDVPRALLVESLTVSEGGEGFPELITNWSGRIFAVVDVAATADPEEGDPADPDAQVEDGEVEDGEEADEGDDEDVELDDDLDVEIDEAANEEDGQ